MKRYPIAFSIVCAASIILFGVSFALLKLLGVSEAQTVSVAVAGLPTAAFPQLKEYLERDAGRKGIAAGKRTPVYDFHAFQIEWRLMIVYGTAVLWCLVQAGGLAVLVFLPRADDLTGMLAILVQMNNLVIVVAAYFVGRWVGTRCSQRGVITICLIAALAATSLVVADTLLFAPDEAYTGVFKQERFGVRDNLTRIGRILPFTIVPLFIGYWRGRKQRLSKYLHYLLGVLPAETRDVTVELAFDEAKKVAGRARLAVS